ncbi:MAG: FtsX-like permease family protein [Nocardioides marinisabuli]|uniref:FtsX-like permease family protein n=1 Tax=Nocardioides marinisabuli TaxID=419476 RepID=UPI003219A625
MNLLTWLRGWRLPLRVAWRDARRARARSLLVLVMIALPVAAVAIADTVYSTAEVSGGEVLERRLGTAAALVEVQDGAGRVFQKPDPDQGQAYDGGGDGEPLTRAGVLEVLGGERTTSTLRQGWVQFETELGLGDADVVETRLGDPLTEGLVDLLDGRWPTAATEVVVSPELLERDPGAALTLADGTALSIVGTAESTRYTGHPRAFGLPGAFGLGERGSTSYLVGGAPVGWEQVLELNEQGAVVLSRAVMTDPPADDELPMKVQWGSALMEASVITTIVLVVVMVLLEVVLLAGPAFAVGARRSARTLALMAAAGGTPAQSRRVVLASGVVLGGVAAVLGLVLGVLGARALLPLVQRFSDTRFGPFDVVWSHLLAVAAFGLVSALLAAMVPAWLASRQDVVAVLGGRRGDARASRRSPLVGLVLLGAGVAAAAYGATAGSGDGEVLIAASALLSVLGMVLLVPVVVVAVARVSARLPLPLRFAARDAARHRSRTVPAVAAVAATVAGVVALGIAITSDEAQNRGGYRASLPMDAMSVVDYRRDADYDAHATAVRGVAPGLEVQRLRGVDQDTGRYTEVRFRREGGETVLSSYGGAFAGSVLVAEEVPGALTGLSDDDRAAGQEALDAGGALVYSDAPLTDERATVVLKVHGRDGRREQAVLPATYVTVDQGYAPVQGVLSPAAAERLGAPVTDVGLYLPGPVGAAQERDISETVQGAAVDATVYAERGYQAPDETVIVQLVLAGLGAVLMLGGTLTATFLALSDARPDLATLSAVGAAPRTRRGVAAAYALVVGLVGAVLGALVGAVPGVAITYPLTAPYGFGDAVDVPSHYLDVPWLMVVGVVVGLPLLTSALVGLTARSRLPLVARLD